MPASYQPSEHLVHVAERAAEKVGVHSLKGLVLSGDSFMSDPNRVLELKQMFQSPACAEMEAGAIGYYFRRYFNFGRSAVT